MSLHDDLERLSAVHGASALASAFASLQAGIRRRRAKLKATLGVLAQTFLAAMQNWDAQKRAGVSQAEREAGLEQTLRAAWPQTREWKYLCQTCRDFGLEIRECQGDATCGRTVAHGPHEYGAACWCSAGAKFRPKAKTTDDELAAVGKVGKGFSRFGR